MIRIPIQVLVLLALLVPPAAAAGEAPPAAPTFPIALSRPRPLGVAMPLAARGETRSTMRVVDGDTTTVGNEETQLVLFDGTVTVVEADPHGRPLHLAFGVRTCSIKVNGEPQWSIAGGTLVLRRGGDRSVIEHDGVALDGPRTELLEAALGPGLGAELDLDAAFGSRSPRRVGEAWPVDAAVVARELGRSIEMKIDPAKVSGTTTVVAQRELAGQPCLGLRTELKLDGIVPPPGVFPAIYEVRSLVIEMERGGLLPVDVRQPALDEYATMTMRAVLAGPVGTNGEQGELHLETVRSAGRSHLARPAAAPPPAP